jgi:AcrR family transcriptional regulator
VRELAIESIAREAGVGKATIYRWWPNKAAIVIDAFFSEAAPLTNFPAADSAKEVICAQCARLIEVLNGPLGKVVAQIIGEGQSNEVTLEKFREVFLQHRRTEFRKLYERGVREHEFRAGVDVDLAADLVYGPVWYRLLVAHQPLDEKFAEQLPKLAIAALAA